jgi:type I restriction enzyme M protein
MHWIAPTEKDTAAASLEKNLWDAADQFRANSGLKAQEYSGPILGLIFLRFAETRFSVRRAELEQAGASSRRGSRVDEPAAYHAGNVLYLAPEARFDYLLTLPEASDIGAKVNAAMREIEKHNPQLAGVLPKTYNLFTGTLLKELLKKVSEIPASTDFDAFGRIYEYFLGEFARTEGQKGGEFYTPASIVKLLTEIIEPFHGRILDPACGSGGMFVQSARFVAEHHKNPAAELAICGVEKTDETGRLCRLNLAVHGLEGDIRHGGNVNSYYDDPHNASPSSPSGRGAGGEGGTFDFVLANPPFNVNAVDKERLKDMIGPGRRFPFGLPRTDNANYLWIQLFYSALNDHGRAGFVMANSASDARASEQELRQKLVESGAVDVMIAVGPNMFYTVTLPCTLWFLDRGKAKTQRAGTVLFIDARHIYRQVDRAHRDWTSAQIGFIANLVRLYRGEKPDYTLGGIETQTKLTQSLSPLPVGEGPGVRELGVREPGVSELGVKEPEVKEPEIREQGARNQALKGSETKPHPASPDKRKPIPAEIIAFARELRQHSTDAENLIWQLVRDRRLGGFKFRRQHPVPPYVLDFYCHDARLCIELDGSQHAGQMPYDQKRDTALSAQGIRTLRFWNNEVFSETESVLEAVWVALHQPDALTPTPLPEGEGLVYRDVPGLCKVATIAEIEAQGWSLNPGRYVGVAPGEEVSDEDFKEQLEALNEELEVLNAQARELEQTIAANVAGILET